MANKENYLEKPCADRMPVHFMSIQWKIQTIRKMVKPNGIQGTRNYISPKVCVIDTTINLLYRARTLVETDDLSICLYKIKAGKMIHLTANNVSKLVRQIAKECHPHLSDDS